MKSGGRMRCSIEPGGRSSRLSSQRSAIARRQLSSKECEFARPTLIRTALSIFPTGARSLLGKQQVRDALKPIRSSGGGKRSMRCVRESHRRPISYKPYDGFRASKLEKEGRQPLFIDLITTTSLPIIKFNMIRNVSIGLRQLETEFSVEPRAAAVPAVAAAG